jgi:hypothetical protein
LRKKQNLSLKLKDLIINKLFKSLYDKFGLKVSNEINLELKEKYKYVKLMTSMTVYNKFQDFSKKFNKMHTFQFFELTQSQVELFCKKYFPQAKKQKLFFQTKNNLKREYEQNLGGSLLSTKNKFICKSNNNSEILKNKKNNNLKENTLKPEKINSNICAVKTKNKELIDFNHFKNNFLFNFGAEIDSYYSVKNIKNIFTNLKNQTLINKNDFSTNLYESKLTKINY